MGNPTLIIVINENDVYEIKGTDWKDREDAIILAMTMHNKKYIEFARMHPKLTAEIEEEINQDAEFKTIKIYEK